MPGTNLVVRRICVCACTTLCQDAESQGAGLHSYHPLHFTYRIIYLWDLQCYSELFSWDRKQVHSGGQLSGGWEASKQSLVSGSEKQRDFSSGCFRVWQTFSRPWEKPAALWVLMVWEWSVCIEKIFVLGFEVHRQCVCVCVCLWVCVQHPHVHSLFSLACCRRGSSARPCPFSPLWP